MTHLKVENAYHAYASLLQNVLHRGEQLASRGGDVIEVEDMTVSYFDPEKTETPRRDGSAPLIGYMEGAQLIGSFEANAIMRVAWPKYFEFSDGYGNYGARASINDQLKYVFDELKTNPDTRRAVITLWNPQFDVPSTHLDHPCTLAIEFRVRKQTLNMTVTMRSQDMWLGHPYDMIQFGLLHSTFAKALELTCGVLTHRMGSCHIYIRDIPNITYFLDEYELETAFTSKYHDPIPVLPISEPGWTYEQIREEAIKCVTFASSPTTECGTMINELTKKRLLKFSDTLPSGIVK